MKKAVKAQLDALDAARQAHIDAINRQFDALKAFYEALLKKMGMW